MDFWSKPHCDYPLRCESMEGWCLILGQNSGCSPFICLSVSLSPLLICPSLCPSVSIWQSPLPFRQTKIDKQPGNLPSPRGLQHWQLCPPRTTSNVIHCWHVLNIPSHPSRPAFCTLRLVMAKTLCWESLCVRSSWNHVYMVESTVYFSPLWEMLLLYLSGHVLCHNTRVSTSRAVGNGILEA